MSSLRAAAGRASIGVIAVVAACTAEPLEFYLPERSVPPDVGSLPADFGALGGPVLVRVTDWPNGAVLGQLGAAGLRPLPGYDRIERLDSIGMSYVGGVVAPGGLDRILTLEYVVRLEPMPKSMAHHKGDG